MKKTMTHKGVSTVFYAFWTHEDGRVTDDEAVDGTDGWTTRWCSSLEGGMEQWRKIAKIRAERRRKPKAKKKSHPSRNRGLENAMNRIFR